MNEEIEQEENTEPAESEVAATEPDLENTPEAISTASLSEEELSEVVADTDVELEPVEFVAVAEDSETALSEEETPEVAADAAVEPELVEVVAVAEDIEAAMEDVAVEVVVVAEDIEAAMEDVAEENAEQANKVVSEQEFLTDAPPISEDEFPSELDLGDDFTAPESGDSNGDPIQILISDEAVPVENGNGEAPVEIAPEEPITATREELKPAIECLLFVADEPLPFKQLCKVLGEVSEEDVLWALGELAAEYDARSSGLEIREIAGGWRISTRPQNHEFVRKYLKSRPSARLSLPALETLAVIAYKQPITIPEILEIRGVSSSSAIKTLLEKRLIVTKGRKETVGKPMMYGTSKEFLIQFGLKDLNELPSIEDFEDLAQ